MRNFQNIIGIVSILCGTFDDLYYGHQKTKSEWDIRLYTDIPRGTEAYKEIYNQRTATERIYNRILNGYGLHRLMIHRKEHYSFLTAMIGICIHLDARYKQLLAAA